MPRNTCRIPAVALYLIAACGSAAGAQSVPEESPSVVLVTGASMPAGKRAMVLVRPNAVPHEVIVLDSMATAEDVAASLSVLHNIPYAFRRGSLQQEIRAFPTTFNPKAGLEAADRARYAQYLRDLKSAKPRELDRLGRLRAIDIPRPVSGGIFR